MEQSFLSYMRTKGIYCWIAAIAIPLQFMVFKFLYPYPSFIWDSWSYIAAAALHSDIGIWPTGYSKFLGLLHFFSHSDLLVVVVQYLMLELSGLLFLFAIGYFIRPGKWVFNALFVFFIFSPLNLYVSNLITSDALFTALSLLWATQLLWILYRPSVWPVILQGLLLTAAFTVRYNALYYPVIGTSVLLLSSLRWHVKLAGVVLSSGLIVAYILHIENKFAETAGVRTFSPFGGWQLANNALYMYEHIAIGPMDTIPARFRELDSMVRRFMAVHAQDKYTLERYNEDIYYMWNPQSPLSAYSVYYWRNTPGIVNYNRWISMGPVYSAYGGWLIRKYPGTFLHYFVFRNVLKYITPPLENLQLYNEGTDELDPRVRALFEYKGLRVRWFSKDFRITTLLLYPAFFALINVALILCLLLWFLFKGYKVASRSFRLTVLIIATFWLINFAFSTFSSPIVFRHQIFAMMLYFTFALMLVEVVWKLANENANGASTGTIRK